jgi:hypothetical protein
VIVTEDNFMWAGGGNDLVQVADLNQNPSSGAIDSMSLTN